MNKDFLVSGLRKQQDRLNELIQQFEKKERLEELDFFRYDEITKQIEKDLKGLRERGLRAF